MKKFLRVILVLLFLSLLSLSFAEEKWLEFDKKSFSNGSISYPKLVNLENKFILDKVNKKILEELKIDDISSKLENKAHMSLNSEAKIHTVDGKPRILSIKAELSEENNPTGTALRCINFDLLTGEKLEKKDIFSDVKTAAEKIEEKLDSYIEDKVFLEKDSLLPIELENIFISDKSIEIFYKKAKNLSGKPFSFHLFDYEINGLLSANILSLDSRKEVEDKKSVLDACLKNGKFDFLPVKLSDNTEKLYNKYSKLHDSEAFIDGRRIFLEDARFRDIELVERKNSNEISGILLKRAELVGIKIDLSSKADVLKAFGNTESIPFEESLNEYYGLDVDEVLVYNGHGKSISFYFSEGTLKAIYLSKD